MICVGFIQYKMYFVYTHWLSDPTGTTFQMHSDQIRKRRPRRYPLQIRRVRHYAQMLNIRIRHIFWQQNRRDSQLFAGINGFRNIRFPVVLLHAQFVRVGSGSAQIFD